MGVETGGGARGEPCGEGALTGRGGCFEGGSPAAVGGTRTDPGPGAANRATAR